MTVQTQPTQLETELRAFLAVSSAGSLSSVGRSRPIWANYSINELCDSAAFVWENIPVAKPAVLSYVGLLVHEGVHIYLLQKESSTNVPTTEASVLSSAVERLCVLLRDELQREGGDEALLKWSVELLVGVTQRNSGRRATTAPPLGQAALTRLYTCCPCVAPVASLVLHCAERLFAAHPESCMSALTESAVFGGFSDWILAYMSGCFPPEMAVHVLSVGLEEVGEVRQRSSTPTSTDDPWLKLRSVAAVAGHLARQRCPQLADQLRSLVQEGLSYDADEKQRSLAIPFVLKVCQLSPELTQFVAADLCQLLTPSNAQKAAERVTSFGLKTLFADQNVTEMLFQMLAALPAPERIRCFEQLLPIAFPDAAAFKRTIADELMGSAEQVSSELSDGARNILEMVLSKVSEILHYNLAIPLDGLPLLNKVESHLLFYVDRLLCAKIPEAKSFYLRLLNSMIFIAGEGKGAQVLAYMLARSKTAEQLHSFVAMMGVLRPFYANLPQESVRRLPSVLECLEIDGSKVDYDCLFENVDLLLHWESDSSPDDVECQMLGLSEAIVNQFGAFIGYLLQLLIDKRAPSAFLHLSAILRSVGAPPKLPPRDVFNLSRGFVRLLADRLSNTHTDEDCHVFRQLASSCLCFVASQATSCAETFLVAFLDRIFEDHSTIFYNDDKSASSVETRREEDGSLLAQLGDLSSRPNAAALVHSGSIRRRRPPISANEAMQTTACIRSELLLWMLDSFCLKRSVSAAAEGEEEADLESNGDACRQLALALNQRLCADEIAAALHWRPWTEEKHTIGRYLTTTKRLDEFCFAWDALFLIAEAYPCLWFCLPVVKALLASVMAQCEGAVNKDARPSPVILRLLDRWFQLVAEGDLLPERMVLLNDMFSQISNYDVFSVLLDIWNYFMECEVDENRLRHHFELLQLGIKEVEPIRADIGKHMQMARVVLQKNIASVGYLFPKLFAIEFES